ncbi:MAG: aromatic ring-hydroxylating dioxygenase subunit alpha [Deltaproteobacteria bacterium]|nr:aromatic ring-hydroxylating dioxygenase subunit alpha [Deltaproteobacteria bacterium]MBW2361524.1 aromatic ring-hydroxylating dioxygenase subunit alpha [Deltaproteobacteria bacterium]
MQEETNGGAIDLEAEWRGMQRRLVERLKGGQKSDLADGVVDLDTRVYTDEARFAAERQRIFREEPMLVAFSRELAEPGDRVVFDAAGPPIVVIRGADRSLRAFLNMCTHRGARLVNDCKPSKGLLCPFHGWTFALEGELSGVPLAQAFEGIDRKALGLVRVPVAEWNGMVFVKAQPGEDQIDVEAFLGPIAPLLTALDLGSLDKVRADRLDLRANWKLALDMGREVYHVPFVHRNTIGRNLHANVAIFDCYGRHNRFSGASLDFDELVGTPEEEWPEMRYQGVHYLFPNVTLSFTHVFDGKTPVVTMSRVFPGDSIGEAMTLMATYKRGGADAAPDEQVAALHDAVLGIVGSEDYSVAETVWQNISNGAQHMKFPLGRNELLVQRYHRDVAERIGMPLP